MIRFALVSERGPWWLWILDTWENRRVSMVHRKGVTTSGDSSSSRTSPLLTHASIGDVADGVTKRTTPYLLSYLPPDDEAKKAYLMLYAVIVSCIKNRPLRLIMDTPSRDGREALRKLDAEYRPTYRGRQMALPRRIMHPKLNSADSDAEYINKLPEWQQVERISGSELDQTVRKRRRRCRNIFGYAQKKLAPTTRK